MKKPKNKRRAKRLRRIVIAEAIRLWKNAMQRTDLQYEDSGRPIGYSISIRLPKDWVTRND